ncbi:MAG: 5'-nucleotidase C-terminal domain-containing protein [Prevotella sp.]|jgi:2',3'-cyclic-nucleotide 2'-phosphodiesterase (5'-nucleotidase family)|nr:5'-nucleotidase C-terminal domain-containing protein [Prevotella sp.]
MRKCLIYIVLLAVLTACGTKRQYFVTALHGERLPVLAAKTPDPEMLAFVDSYKHKLDKEMNQVIGRSLQSMTAKAPESLLTNFTSDVMLLPDENIVGKKADLSVMNIHGHRASMPEGDITVGNIFEIYSFDNMLAVLQLKGADLMDLFRAYARMGGTGISSTVRLVIKDKQLLDAKIDGKAVVKDKLYTIVTLDYLADGNDGMDALKKAVSVKNTGITLRDYMLDYIKDQTAKGQAISSKLDGRISIE